MLVPLSAGCQTPFSLLRQRETTNTPFDVSQGDQHIPLFGGDDALRQSFAHLLQGGELLIGINASRRNDRIQKNMRPLAAAQAGTRAHGQATSTSSIPRGLFRVTVKSGVAGGKLHGA